MQLTRSRVSSRAAKLQSKAGRNFCDGQGVELLEARQLMTLLGVNLTELPLAFFVGNISSGLTYNAATRGFDVVAVPNAVITPAFGYADIIGGNLQIHQKVANDGTLTRGVNPNEVVANGSVNANGDDFIVTGGIDLDFSGTIDAGEPQGVLLRGEVIAFGFQDSGGPSDDYDFKFVVTGGILASYFTNRDIGVNLVSELSNFTGSFATNFSGQSKGAVGPVEAGSPGVAAATVAGRVFCDENADGIFDAGAGDMGFGSIPVRLFGINDLGQSVDVTIQTSADGTYSFGGLRPGTYSVAQLVNPAGTQDGTDYVGTAGGTAGNDVVSNIVLPPGVMSLGNDFTERCLSSISGTVFFDGNNDGLINNGDTGIAGVTVTLTGTTLAGGTVSLITQTDSQGRYSFANLFAGTYTIIESQPAAYLDGKDSAGTVGGVVTNDRVSSIVLAGGVNASEYNFGELLAPVAALSQGDTATIGFWHNRNGQALIRSFNGSASSTGLSSWLSTTFPNIWGANAGSNNVTGKTNTQMAAIFLTKFRITGPKWEAQMLASALAVYATSSTLSGGTMASGYGFNVGTVGTSAKTVNTGSQGTVLGLANNTQVTVLQALQAANTAAAGGALFLTGNTALRLAINDLFDRINRTGGI